MDIRESFVKHEIIEPMQRLFLPPRSMDESDQLEALREYVSALKRFPQDALRQGWIAVRDTHDGRGWPAVAVFVSACKLASREEQARSRGDPYDPDAEAKRWMTNFHKFCDHRGLSAQKRATLLLPIGAEKNATP
jgi:hypothetical protein